jgi:hypothetical protein
VMIKSQKMECAFSHQHHKGTTPNKRDFAFFTNKRVSPYQIAPKTNRANPIFFALNEAPLFSNQRFEGA